MFFNLYEIYFYQRSKRSHLKNRLNERKGTSRNVRVRKMNFDGRSSVDRFRVPRFLGTEESCQIETASRVIARPLSVARACNRRWADSALQFPCSVRLQPDRPCTVRLKA